MIPGLSVTCTLRRELAEVVGWLAYDAEAHDLCRRMNQESLYFTRLAGDKTVELLTLQNSSMHAAAEGRPREAHPRPTTASHATNGAQLRKKER